MTQTNDGGATDLTTDALKLLAARLLLEAPHVEGWEDEDGDPVPFADDIRAAVSAIREVIDRRGAEAGMRALLRAGCDLLADEYDNLKASITMLDGSLSANPLDAWAVEKVAAMDDWIASVKATLYRATPTTEASHGE